MSPAVSSSGIHTLTDLFLVCGVADATCLKLGTPGSTVVVVVDVVVGVVVVVVDVVVDVVDVVVGVVDVVVEDVVVGVLVVVVEATVVVVLVDVVVVVVGVPSVAPKTRTQSEVPSACVPGVVYGSSAGCISPVVGSNHCAVELACSFDESTVSVRAVGT
jgi:hypothetical protein